MSIRKKQPEVWCPRRAETGSKANGPDSIARGGSCSYCGSMHPDDFMEVARGAAEGELGPTDKSYKVYVDPGYRKFYFQHLSEEQKQEFVDLYNARPRRTYSEDDLSFIGGDGPGMQVGYPGYFYSLPFFMERVEQVNEPVQGEE